MKNLSHLLCPLMLLASVGVSLALQPLVLDPINGVTATSPSGSAEGSPAFTVSNNSLVAGASNILGASDSLGDSGFNSGDASDFGNWVTGNTGSATITFNLNGNYNVSNLLIWNFSQIGFANVGFNQVTILTSTDGVLFTPVVGPNLGGSFTFNEAPEAQYDSPRPIAGNNPPHPTGGTATEPAQILPVDLENVHYVELLVQSNYGSNTGLTGVNEVNFVGEAVPEPATWAMMGLGLIGLVAWQRKWAAFRI